MKYPLDRICVKSGIFCTSCQRKLDLGEVDKEEVEIIKTLMELEESYVEFRKGEYVKSYVVNNTVIILLRNGWEAGEIGKLVKTLSSKLNKRVKIIQSTSDYRSIVEQILSPIHIIGINRVWLPDGSEQFSITVSRRDRRRLENISEWEKLLTKLLGKPTRIRFN